MNFKVRFPRPMNLLELQSRQCIAHGHIECPKWRNLARASSIRVTRDRGPPLEGPPGLATSHPVMPCHDLRSIQSSANYNRTCFVSWPCLHLHGVHKHTHHQLKKGHFYFPALGTCVQRKTPTRVRILSLKIRTLATFRA